MIEVINTYDKLTKGLNSNIKWFKAHKTILPQKEHHYLYPVFEKAMYIAISASDLNIALKYLDVSQAVRNGFETNYFARNVALITYEIINHQQKIVGPIVSKTVKDRLGDDALSQIKLIQKGFKDITKNHHKTLNYIRNNLFGHRIHDGQKMADGMLAIDPIEIYKVGSKAFGVLYKIHLEYSNILEKIS